VCSLIEAEPAFPLSSSLNNLFFPVAGCSHSTLPSSPHALRISGTYGTVCGLPSFLASIQNKPEVSSSVFIRYSHCQFEFRKSSRSAPSRFSYLSCRDLFNPHRFLEPISGRLTFYPETFFFYNSPVRCPFLVV